VNGATIIAILSIISIVILCIGIGIVFIPPIVFEALSSYYADDEILMGQIEEAPNSTLMMSTLPTLSSALLILGLVGLGIQGLLKNKLSSLPSKS
jgi:predicted membrane-bound spermidine synthase